MSVEVRDSFSFASPPSVLRALDIYCSAYYGTLAGWDLRGKEANQFFGVWRINVLLAHNLPRGTHRYFLPLLAPGAVSARSEILARFAGFFRGLRKAPSHEIVTAALLCARDMRTTLGRNISYIEELTGLDVWVTSPSRMRKTLVKLETVSPPPEDTWRLKYLEKLIKTEAGAARDGDGGGGGGAPRTHQLPLHLLRPQRRGTSKSSLFHLYEYCFCERNDNKPTISNTLLCSSKTTCVNFAENTKYII